MQQACAAQTLHLPQILRSGLWHGTEKGSEFLQFPTQEECLRLSEALLHPRPLMEQWDLW